MLNHQNKVIKIIKVKNNNFLSIFILKVKILHNQRVFKKKIKINLIIYKILIKKNNKMI